MKKYFSFIIVFVLLIAACSKDDDGGGFDGSMEDIIDFAGSELLDSIVGMGMVIHPGNNPPNIEGKFLEEHILESSNVPNERRLGERFPDFDMEFTNQRGLKVDFYAEEDISQSNTTIGEGSLISGEGDVFSVFLKVKSEIDGKIAEGIIIISGKMVFEGIYDYKFANFMLDNHGHESRFIPNNTGRIFVDEDGLVERR